MKSSKFIAGILCFTIFISLISSCEKVNIEFGESVLADDPNITFIDNYKVNIATFKPDSFSTSSNEILSLGYHYDSVFGIVKAGSYLQLNLPSINPVADQTLAVTFDSLELIIKPSGEFYGDSTRPLKINVYRLTQNITDPVNNTDVYYNTTSFAYDPATIGQQIVTLYGKSGTAVHIRLSDALGQELLTKFKNNHEDISSAERFVNYFKGIYISTDSVVTNSLAYFSAPSDSVIVRLNYHDNGLFPEKKYIDFTYKKEKQFNNLNFRYINPDFSAFINKKTQLIPSTSSANQSYFNTNLGATIKMSFPTILNLKELHPYVKIVKAELVIKPDTKSYTYPYHLPETLNLYTTDENNYPISPIYYNNTSLQIPQTGNLSIDYLYGESTNYSYDITGFINTLLDEGQFSTSAIILYHTLANFYSGTQRLILNDQNSSRSVQLKLYVLGL